MAFLNIKEKYIETRRVVEIVEVLFSFGLEDLFDKTNLSKKFSLPLIDSSAGKNKKITTPERVRMAFEKLGPAFVKFGQVLSTRPDILPYSYIKELQKLQDAVLPVSFHEIKTEIHTSLGKTIDDLFKEFSHEPVASASIAQVHEAILPDGTRVAVKVKRPHIEEIISADTKIILELAKFLKNKKVIDRIWRPVEISEQLDRSLKEELDFGLEISNQKKFIANFANTPEVKIPRIFDNYSGDNIITMEYFDGVKLNKIVSSRGKKFPKKEIAVIGAHAIFKQIFIDGFFHGDLHPGNLFWLDKKHELGLIDFGIVGRLREEEMKAFTLMLNGIINFDSEKVLFGIETLNIVDSSQQAEELKGEIDILLGKYYNAALKEIKIAILIQEIFGVMLKLKIRLPVNLVNLAKTLVTVEDLATKLDPEFNIFSFSKPYIEASARKQMSLVNVKNKIENNLLRSGRLMENLPNDLQWLLKNLKNNDFKIKIEHQKLQSVLEEIAKTGNTLSASLIVAGLVIGSSYVMPTFREIGLFGYIIASFIGLFILIGMLKRSKI